jgi:hypothetical protein
VVDERRRRYPLLLVRPNRARHDGLPAGLRSPKSESRGRSSSGRLSDAVWTCAQHGGGADTSATLRDLTRRTIAHYSDPGDLVLDPRCRTGIALDRTIYGPVSGTVTVAVARASFPHLSVARYVIV